MIPDLRYAEVYVICDIILLTVFYWSYRGGERSAASRWFFCMLGGFIVSFAANTLWTVTALGMLPNSAPYVGQYTFKIIYYIALNFGMAFWTIYCETMAGSSFFNLRENRLLFGLPLAFIILGALTTPWTTLLFYINAKGAYVREVLFQFQMAIMLIYSAVPGTLILYRSREEVDAAKRNQMVLTGVFPIWIMAAWIMTLILPSCPIICVAISMAILISYMGSSTGQISVDKLTQINNRQNMITYIRTQIRQHTDNLYLLMMDVNSFKKINDTFGHLEGDQALVRIANALKGVCEEMKKRPFLARYGGDEFIIVLECANEAEVEKFCEDIHTKIKYYNDWAQVEYDLTMSIGVAKWKEGMDHTALIAAADQALYDVKEKYHATHSDPIHPGAHPEVS